MKCTRCDNRLNAEEQIGPKDDDDENIICDGCYKERYKIIGIRCENYADAHGEIYFVFV
jgi:hypothetical protein